MDVKKRKIEEAVWAVMEATEGLEQKDLREMGFKWTHTDALKHLELTFAKNEFISGQVMKRNENKI